MYWLGMGEMPVTGKIITWKPPLFIRVVKQRGPNLYIIVLQLLWLCINELCNFCDQPLSSYICALEDSS